MMSTTLRAALLSAVLGAGPLVAGAGQDACSLLTADEIEAIQGDRLKHAKASTPPRPGLEVSQCFFATETFENSISLELTRPSSEAESGPRDFWRHTFDRSWQDPAEAPYPVEGLGDEAFWLGRGGPAGALYVLRGDRFFRLSLGGAADDEARLERSRRLAAWILARL